MYNKIISSLSLETLFKLTNDLRSSGKTIGFTHGTFDLFHEGHLFLISQASYHCDFLIVAIESDENVRKYKNVDRPIQDQKERLNTLNSILYVGNAFLNTNEITDEWYTYLYRELHINFLAIGKNFGAIDEVQRRTNRLGIGLEKFEIGEQSTSRLIRKIVRRS